MAKITSVVGGIPTIVLDYGETYTFGTGDGNVFVYAGETYPEGDGTLIAPGHNTIQLVTYGPTTVISSGQNTMNLGTGQFVTVDAGPNDTITSGSGFPTINAVNGDTITSGAGSALVNIEGGTVSIDELNPGASVVTALPAVIAQAQLSGAPQIEGGPGFTLTAPGLQVNLAAQGQLNFLDGSINDPSDATINAYYELALGRPVDLIGLGSSLAAVQVSGTPPGTLSPQTTLFLADKTQFFQGIVESPEFQAKYVNLSNGALLDTLYHNSNTREDAAGAAFWTGLSMTERPREPF